MSYEARPTGPQDDHFFHVEVTVAACVGTPDNRILGKNLVDVTVGFSMSMARPPEGASDELINRTLTHHVSPILAAVQVALTSLGFAALGTIDEPMTERSTWTGEFGKSSPVRVQLYMPEPEAEQRPGRVS